MVRFEKDKLIIEMNCMHIEPESELHSLCSDILFILRSQNEDFYTGNKAISDHLLDFVMEIMPAANQIKNTNKL